jgi:hypothetical protein
VGVSKYIATAIGLVLMIWTYDLAHSERDVALDQRRDIETNLEDTISQYIKARRPGVTDVVFQQLYSEDIPTPGNDPTASKQMLVRFRYLTNEPSTATDGKSEMTEQVFEGSVRLKSADGLTWQWMDENVHSPLIRYKNGTEIRATGGDPAE